ncbi:hypothetical protein ACQP1G_18810 [Nocardia sp. CA-107356]|uniref:hypothetical protein n=1 Tax=Nocardia sp. CA-107356 TaxID=3239972 RepID=UPI003D8EB4BC
MSDTSTARLVHGSTLGNLLIEANPAGVTRVAFTDRQPPSPPMKIARRVNISKSRQSRSMNTSPVSADCSASPWIRRV